MELQNDLQFPYKRDLLNVEELWNNALNLDLVEIKTLYTNDFDTKRPRGWRSIPRWIKWKYKGKLLCFIVSTEAYDKVDKLVDYFSEKQRMEAHKKGVQSPVEYYKSNYDTLLIKARDMEQHSNNSECLPLHYWLREAVYMAKVECTSFKITASKCLYKFLNSKVVLDPSAGWGDRLLGAAAADVEIYHGVDPNSLLRSSYDEMLSFVDKDYTVVTDDFLKVNIDNDTYDTVFTSPPFFDFEIYSSDANQSICGRSGLKDWIENFLYPYISKAWYALKIGGHLCLYITDTKTDKYIADMYNFVNNRLKGQYLGVIALSTSDLTHAYPIWIWRRVK